MTFRDEVLRGFYGTRGDLAGYQASLNRLLEEVRARGLEVPEDIQKQIKELTSFVQFLESSIRRLEGGNEGNQ